MGHLVTLRIIAEECHKKIDLFCCFVDFKKDFGIIPRTKLWKMVKEIMVPLELRVVVTRFYKKVISRLSTGESWLGEFKYNIKAKEGCPLSSTIFGI